MSQRVLRISLVVLLAGGIGLAWWSHARVTPAAVVAWVEGLGVWGPLVFVGVYSLAPALFFPGAVLTLAGGALFGPLLGAFLSLAWRGPRWEPRSRFSSPAPWRRTGSSSGLGGVSKRSRLESSVKAGALWPLCGLCRCFPSISSTMPWVSPASRSAPLRSRP